jgi:transcriptional regulator with XRE-family HTH domain
MPCPKTPFPRANIPERFRVWVQAARKERGWSQDRLAAKVGVSRKTIGRLERGLTDPSSRLVNALLRDEVLGKKLKPIPGWEVDDPDEWKPGPRARAVRLCTDQTLAQIVSKAGGSVASLSAFERGLLAPVAYVGEPEHDNGDDVTEGYARALCFESADKMREYLSADDPRPWLVEIARRCGRPLPPAALLPTRRIRFAD